MRRRTALVLVVVAAAAGFALVSAAPARSATWCGSGEPTADLPDAVDAYSIHVVYALPSGSTDRFAEVAAQVAGDTAAMTSWWQHQDSTRKPRFDLFDASGCPDDFGRVDVSLLRLPYAAGAGSSYAGVVAAVASAGFASPDKGYLVYVDDKSDIPPSDTTQVCGQGNVDGTALGYAVVYLQSCSIRSDDDARRIVVTHELVHAMGGVDPSAPH